jgi:hypothetical protein
VVVWYDGESAFRDFVRDLAAPNCAVVLAEESRLRARRQADEVLCRLNDPGQPTQAKAENLLIYCPWSRGRNADERLQDPFEGFARVGVAFGDKEVETLQSLARKPCQNAGLG